MKRKAFQDYYPDPFSHCYGCGRLNEQGLQIKSYWEGDESVAVFHPKPYHTAIPGYVYGGLLASLIDCHCTGTAAAAAYRAEGREMDTEPALRFLTGSLHVEYLRPTPIGGPLEVRARVKEITGRKVIVVAALSAKGEVCARGEVVAVRMPEHLERRLLSEDRKGVAQDSSAGQRRRRMQIKANGIQMNYELTGKEEGPVLVLSHSLGCSLEMWNPQMASLESRFRVLRYDTRGHGGTEAPAGAYTFDLLTEDVIGLLDALDLSQVHFIGLSMGGMIGQYLALKYPQRLRSLILCDTAAVVSKENQPVWQARIDAARENGLRALVDATLERWFSPPFLNADSPMVALIRRQFLATPVKGYLGCSEAIRNLNTLHRLSEIEIPALIIVGEEDPGTPVSAARAIHERIRNSRLLVIPAARHLTNVEQPEVFNRAILDFLGEPLDSPA